MKENRLAKIVAAAAAGMLAISVASAQQTTTTTTDSSGTTTVSTTDAAGTIMGYTPDRDYITFRTQTAPAPVRYYYNKQTTIVDPEGHTVAWTDIRPDMPATVYYTAEGDRMVVHKIMLSQPVTVYKKETTTTTTTERP
jgi:hypothetical protein